MGLFSNRDPGPGSRDPWRTNGFALQSERVDARACPPADGPTDVREYARELARRRGLQWLALPATLRTRACPCASVSSASRPCGRRSLAVWPLDSRRMAFPHFTRLGWEIRARGRMVSNLTPVRTLQPVTGALGGDSGGLAAAVVPTGLGLSPCLPLPLGAVPAFEPRRQGGRECAVRYWIQRASRWARTDWKQFRADPPRGART